MPRLLLLAATIALAGCTVKEPVAVIAPDGEILRGTASSMFVYDEFTVREDFAVRGGALECRGLFDPALGSPTVSITVGCSDGRSGLGRAFPDNAASGSGKIRLNDGSEASFVYGEAARGI
jgi:hypothetical protein